MDSAGCKKEVFILLLVSGVFALSLSLSLSIPDGAKESSYAVSKSLSENGAASRGFFCNFTWLRRSWGPWI
jgi:hypothetical protein